MMLTGRSSPPSPISPMNAMLLGIGDSKKLKKKKKQATHGKKYVFVNKPLK